MKRWLKCPRLPRLPRIPAELAVFVLGWLLFAVGLSLWRLPAGFIGAGAVLMLIVIFGDKWP